MADWFLDPVNGNDANNGSTFALRKKTLSSFGTVAAGDRIKIIKSPDPTSMGVCGWTDNSDTITIPAGLVKVLPGFDQAWVASANVTTAVSGTRKNAYSTVCAQTSIQSAFATGKVSYYALPSALDLSAFESISGWFQVTGATLAATALELRFCSDATGDVPVATVPIRTASGTIVNSSWLLARLDNGAALPTGINSISLYANSDPGTCTIYTDNFIACLDPSAAGSIDHSTLFGKNTAAEPWWYNICVFPADTTVQVGGGRDIQYNLSPPPYRGVTESVTSYSRKMLAFGASATANTISGNGSLGSPVYLSGGWDTTAMASQTGVSILDGLYYPNTVLSVPNGFINIEKIGIANGFNFGFNLIPYGSSIQLEGIWGCSGGPISSAANGAGRNGTKIVIKEVWGYANNIANYSVGTIKFDVDLNIGRASGCYSSNSPLDAISNYGYPASPIVIGELSNNRSYGIYNTLTGPGLEIKGCVFKWNDPADVRVSGGGIVSLIGCSLQSAVPIHTGAIDAVASVLEMTAQDGDPTKYFRMSGAGTVGSAGDQTHSGAGKSLKFTPSSTAMATADFPLTGEIARVAVKAGATVFVKVWCRRDNTGLNLGIGVKGNFISGVVDAASYMTAAVNTWEQITLAFTPFADGVVPIYGYAYGGTSYSGWLDDLTISQGDYIEFDLTKVLPAAFTFTRASNAWGFNSAGVLTEAPNDVSRQVYDPVTLTPDGTLVEPDGSSNQVANPRCEGAVPGTPGTMPSNGWSNNNPGTMTTTVVGTGIEDGIPYLDIQFSGTISGTVFFVVYFTNITDIPASNGQTWSQSAYFRLIAGSFGTPSAGPRLQINAYDSGGVFITAFGSTTFPCTNDPLRKNRVVNIATLSGATIASARPVLLFQWTTAQTIDFTLRIGLPQMERRGAASSPIMPPVGSPAVSTRAAESLSLALPFAGFPGAVGWSVAMEFTPLDLAPNATLLGMAGANEFNDVSGLVMSDDTGGLQLVKSVGGDSAVATFATSLTAGTPAKVAIAQDAADARGSLNGGAIAVATLAGYPTMVSLTPAIVPNFDGAPMTLRRLQLWPRALSDDETETAAA